MSQSGKHCRGQWSAGKSQLKQVGFSRSSFIDECRSRYVSGEKDLAWETMYDEKTTSGAGPNSTAPGEGSPMDDVLYTAMYWGIGAVVVITVLLLIFVKKK